MEDKKVAIELDDLKLPIVIGITGHRDIPLESIEPLNFKIKQIFENIIQKYPSTPLILLTPLADGADRIIANVALKQFNNKITVSVPLPMDEISYKDTFGKGVTLLNPDESKREYTQILQNVKQQKENYVPKIIPMLFNQKEYGSLSSDKQRIQRKKQYSIVGEYIAMHSHILVAIYNEESPEEEGGTKEIFTKKLSGEYDYVSILDEDVTYPEQGIVYSISTPRITKEIKYPQNPYVIKKHFPDGSIQIGLVDKLIKENILVNIKNYISSNKSTINSKHNRFRQQHKKIDYFNQNVDKHFEAIKSKALYELSEVDISDKLIKKNMMTRRSAAYLADYYFKPLVEAKEKGVLLIITTIVFLFAIKANIGNFSFSMYIDSIYLLLLIPLYILILELNHNKSKQEDYRSLAEGLRVQVAWNMAEINESVSMYYLSHQRNELDWIRSAIRCTNIFYIPSKTNELKSTCSLNNYWLNSQIQFFNQKIPLITKKEHNNSVFTKTTFMVFLLASSVYFVLNFSTNYTDSFEPYIWNLTLLDIGQILFIVTPITMSTYLKSKQLFDGNKEILREYTLSLDIFTRAKKMIYSQKYNSKNTVKNLGIEALRENSSWIITRRTKEHNVPT